MKINKVDGYPARPSLHDFCKLLTKDGREGFGSLYIDTEKGEVLWGFYEGDPRDDSEETLKFHDVTHWIDLGNLFNEAAVQGERR